MALFSRSSKSELEKNLEKLQRIHPSDRYPTYVFVVAGEAELEAQLAIIEKNERAKALKNDGYLQVATKEDVFRIKGETDLNAPVGKVAMRSDVIHFGAGILYQRHVNPDDPTYFPFVSWAKEMEPLAAVTIFAVLNQLGVKETTFTTNAGQTAVKSIKAQIAAGPEKETIAVRGDRSRKGNNKEDQTYTVKRPEPRRPAQIPQKHMFWMQYAKTLEGGSLLEVAKEIVDGQVPNSFTCKIDLLSGSYTQTSGGVTAKVLSLTGSANRDMSSSSYVEITASFWLPEEYKIINKEWGVDPKRSISEENPPWNPKLFISVENPPPVLETCKEILQDPQHVLLEAASFAGKLASRSLGREGLSGAFTKTAMEALVNGFFNFAVRVSVAGLRGAGKTTFVNSLRMVLAESVYGTGLGMVQNMKFRNGTGGAKSDGTDTQTYDLYKVADVPFVIGDDEFLGGLCFMDTAGIGGGVTAEQVSGRIAKKVEGQLRRLSQRIRGGEEKHQNADAMLVVIDAKDLYKKAMQDDVDEAVRYLEGGLLPLLDHVLSVDSTLPIHVLFTKIDEVEKQFPDDKTGFDAAKQDLEAAAGSAFPNKLKGVHFIHSFTWPAPTSEYNSLVDKVLYAPTEDEHKQTKAAYESKIAEYTRRHRDHLLIMQRVLESIKKKK
jgi:hypothetical protein